MPEDVKEPGYFCFHGFPRVKTESVRPYPDLWKTVVDQPAAYSDLFTPAQKGQLIGEASPEYLYLHARTIDSLRAHYGDRLDQLKIIMVLRNPVDRIWSHYWMALRDGYEGLPFEEATASETIQDRLTNGWHPAYDYRGYGLYADQVEHFLKVFGPDRVKIFLFEDLRRDGQNLCSELFKYLGVSEAVPVDTSTIYNVSGQMKHPILHRWLFCKEQALKSLARQVIPYDVLQKIKHRFMAWNARKVTMPENISEALKVYYRPDVIKLQSLIGRDLSAWLK